VEGRAVVARVVEVPQAAEEVRVVVPQVAEE
jgi:hypothetical protein